MLYRGRHVAAKGGGGDCPGRARAGVSVSYSKQRREREGERTLVVESI